MSSRTTGVKTASAPSLEVRIHQKAAASGMPRLRRVPGIPFRFVGVTAAHGRLLAVWLPRAVTELMSTPESLQDLRPVRVTRGWQADGHVVCLRKEKHKI